MNTSPWCVSLRRKGKTQARGIPPQGIGVDSRLEPSGAHRYDFTASKYAGAYPEIPAEIRVTPQKVS
jgi:hypothetical protein